MSTAPRPSWKLTDRERHQAAQMCARGVGAFEVARRFGVTPQAIRGAYFRRFGALPPRAGGSDKR